MSRVHAHVYTHTYTHILHQHSFHGGDSLRLSPHTAGLGKPAHSCCFWSWPGLSPGSSSFLFIPLPVPPHPRQAQSVTSFPLLGVPWGNLSQRAADNPGFHPGNAQPLASSTGFAFLKHRNLRQAVLKNLGPPTTSTPRHSLCSSTACGWVSKG